MLGWVSAEDTGVFAPLGADKFVGCQALEGFEALGERVNPRKGLQMGAERLGRGVVVDLDGGCLERAV